MDHPANQRNYMENVGRIDTMITPEEYKIYRPLFFAALARLARKGFVIPPAYIMDVIHDFILDEWDEISGKYNPSLRDKSGYVFVWFTRSACKRIVRLRRLEAMGLLGLEGKGEAAHVDEGHDLGQIRRALASLDDESCRVLLDFLDGDSLRDIAGQRGFSRQRTRELLCNAVLAVTLAIGTPAGISECDWEISRAIYERGSIRRATEFLGISSKCAGSIHAANMNILVSRLATNNRSAGRLRGK